LHTELERPGLFDPEHVTTAEAALQRNGVLLVLQGQRGVGKRLLARTVAQRLGRNVLEINSAELASRPTGQQPALLRALVREARLLNAIPVLPDIDDIPGERDRTERGDEPPYFLSLLCSYYEGAIVVTLSRETMPRLHLRPIAHLLIDLPSTRERVELWTREVAAISDADARALAERYAVTGGLVAMSARAARATTPGLASPGLDALDTAVRSQLHGRIQRLGTRLDTGATFADLVADEDTLAALTEITAAIQERRTVRESWGFRGAPGVSVLLSGHPGVGKTMSATVVARALSLEIYEIDLSRVVSKWVGETEKNLAELFDAAEPGHVVLLFNEADSLFGKRTKDVSSSNDRYANMETNYLLQRIERFGGLSILTTNLTKAIDPAFRRRFAYDVHFAFPTSEMRAELWRRTIPARAEVKDVDFDDLGDRFELSGGYIKVAAERTAFNAAARKTPIDMALLIMTIERMYRERGKLSPVGRLE
jgi:SpoVK/Ycf46/Vps4 family AAA+-type ATPase